MGSLRVGHDWATSLFSLSCTGEGNGNPPQFSCLESPRDGGAWWAAVYGVAQSRTWLKRLSSSSSSFIALLFGCPVVFDCFATPWTVCSSPGSSVHGISQARILEKLAISYSRGSSRSKAGTRVSCKSPALAGISFTSEASGKPLAVLEALKTNLKMFC